MKIFVVISGTTWHGDYEQNVQDSIESVWDTEESANNELNALKKSWDDHLQTQRGQFDSGHFSIEYRMESFELNKSHIEEPGV